MSVNATEKIIYKKICCELYEILDMLTENEKNKISKDLIKNIKSNMDTEYNFKIDKNKSLLENELAPQTQALLIKLYEKYLCTDEEKEKWTLYDKLCHAKMKNLHKKLSKTLETSQKYNSIEEMRAEEMKNKKILYNVEENKKHALVEVKKESFWQKLIRKIKEKLGKNY